MSETTEIGEVVFSDIEEHDGYIVEISLPPTFSNEISENLNESSLELNERVGKDNAYIKIGPGRTFDILEDLDLDPFKPELPALLILDKHPKDVKKGDKLVLIKLGALERPKDVPLVLEEMYRLMNTEGFMRNLSLRQKRERFSKAFEDFSKVGVSIVSTRLGE